MKENFNYNLNYNLKNIIIIYFIFVKKKSGRSSRKERFFDPIILIAY